MPDIDYPETYITEITLKDGMPVTLRPIRPDDAPRLQYGFKQLSPQSVYMRFLETFRELTDEQAHHLANVDYHERMAFVGAIQEDGEERLVCVARYALIGPQQPGAAEMAVVVRDDFQGRGLGTQAMIHLIGYARDHGVTHFTAAIHVSNQRVMHMIKRSGLHYSREMLEPGTWMVRMDVMPG